MSYTIIKKMPAIDSILRESPLAESCRLKVLKDRQEIKNILAGEDNRLLVIAGPCSAWPSQAVIDYAKNLQVMNRELSDVMKIVMRVYIQKPRTTKGWTGPINQPNPLAEPDIETGIRTVRKLMLEVLNIGLPIADEALYTNNAKGFMELLSWVAIGARSSENQVHRVFASSIDCPVGMKNPTHGSLAIAVNGMIAAQHPHVAVLDDHVVQTHGNPYAHLVLRGGDGKPNYGLEYLEQAHRLMEVNQIKNPAVLIDASHDNCLLEGKKDHRHQPRVVFETLDMIADNPNLKQLLKGFMLESFMKEGAQKVDPNRPDDLDLGGLSITDPCMSWDQTEDLLIKLGERLR